MAIEDYNNALNTFHTNLFVQPDLHVDLLEEVRDWIAKTKVDEVSVRLNSVMFDF